MVFRITVQQYAVSPCLILSLPVLLLIFPNITANHALYTHNYREMNTYKGVFLSMISPLDLNMFVSLLRKSGFYVHIFCIIGLLPQHGSYCHPKRRRDSAASTNTSHSSSDQVRMYFRLNDAYVSNKLSNLNLWHTKFRVSVL